MPRPLRLAASVALAVAALGAPPAGADTLLSTEPTAPKLSVAGGVAAWSTYDQAVGAWFLVTRRAGVVERAAVAPRSAPFDVDLGRDGAGRLVAAYSRCDREPSPPQPIGRGCDLYAYDLSTREERRLRGPSSDAASEYMPSLWAGRVAFGRVHERRGGAAGNHTTVYVRRLDRGPATPLPGGTRNADDRTGVTGLDLGSGRLALAWRTAGPAGPGIPYGGAELRVVRLRDGQQTFVTRLVGTSLDYGGVATPHLFGRGVRFAMIWVNEGGTTIGDVVEYDFSGTRTALRLPDRVAGVGVSGRDTYYVRCNPEWMPTPGCDVSVRETAAGTDPDVELARTDRPTPLSWYRGWVAFSAYDGALPGYRLILRSTDGAVVQPAVRPRAVPFDVDLGRGPDRALAAVYSRCRVEPRLDAQGLPRASTGRGCDVYRYDVARRRERRVRAAPASEFLPAVDGTRLAFARRDGVYLADGDRLTRVRSARRAHAVDLRGRRVAVASGRRRAIGFDGNVLTWVRRDPGRVVAVRLDLTTRERRTLVLPVGATAYVPWRAWGMSGSYGRTDAAGWSLRTPWMLPELLR